MLAVHFDIGNVVLEDGGDVHLAQKSILCPNRFHSCGYGKVTAGTRPRQSTIFAGCGWWAGVLTSGKVPLEKTLVTKDRLASGQKCAVDWLFSKGGRGAKIKHAHQQAGLAAGTVADNDEFPTELGHGGGLN